MRRKDTESNKSPFYFLRKDKSLDRPKSKLMEVPQPKKTNAVNIVELTQIILEEKRSLERVRVTKHKLVLNPPLNFNNSQVKNLNKEYFNKILASYRYLNEFRPNDDAYQESLGSTPATVSQHLLSLGRLQQETREELRESVVRDLEEYIDQAISQLEL